jgi:hypothetical protein
MQQYTQQIAALAQKVAQAHEAQQQAQASADPTAQVLLKTQMAETQRKAAESQTKLQFELQKTQQDYQIKVAELQQKMQELQAKYQTQSTIDSQRNATQIAMADINNSSRERIAAISAKAGLTSDQMAMQHEQDLLALEASQEAESDIRQHGLDINQQNFLHQTQMAQAAAQQAAQADQQRRQHAVDLTSQAMGHYADTNQQNQELSAQQQQQQDQQQPQQDLFNQQPSTEE